MRVLIGSVGYRHLSDHSFGIVVVDLLALRSWPAAVTVEDISYNPIAVVQRLQDEPAEKRFDVAIVVSAAERPGRSSGTLAVYKWDNVLPPAREIQAAVAEAVTGVISLDNTLVVTRHFGVLAETVVIVEVEPKLHAFGDEMSIEVAPTIVRAFDVVTRLALNPVEAAELPALALGGGQTPQRRPSGIEVKHVSSER